MGALNLLGQRFSRLLVMEKRPNDKHQKTQWLCRCDCGKTTISGGSDLKKGHSRSCGCLQIKHGHSKRGALTPTFRCWYSMKMRCLNPNEKSYPSYGGRGITVCDRWTRFENFLADMGEQPPGLMIERNNNDGNYEPSNCRWATNWEQSQNKRNTVFWNFRGERKTISQWCRIMQFDYDRVYMRVYAGWSIEKALTTPVKHRK